MNEAIEINVSDDGNHLYIFFGGIAAGIAMPPFEFYNASKIIDEHKIFIRDFSQCWYHDGLPGISENIYSTSEHLKKLINDINPDKVFFVGNSMGGYAAILFSNLIERGEVIAFAPQTFISPFLRLRYFDWRWKKQILNTYKRCLLKPKLWDLKSLLSRSNQNRKIAVFVSKQDKLDYIHATHIENIQGVQVHAFDEGGHDIVRLLRDSGKLPDIMSGNYS